MYVKICFLKLSLREFMLEKNVLNIIRMGKFLVIRKVLLSIKSVKFWSKFLNMMKLEKFFIMKLFLLYIKVFI